MQGYNELVLMQGSVYARPLRFRPSSATVDSCCGADLGVKSEAGFEPPCMRGRGELGLSASSMSSASSSTQWWWAKLGHDGLLQRFVGRGGESSAAMDELRELGISGARCPELELSSSSFLSIGGGGSDRLHDPDDDDVRSYVSSEEAGLRTPPLQDLTGILLTIDD
ncbi:hypothetical protein Dimus_002973 [Dionaea muscipula]